MTTPATADPLAGLIADAREIPAVFQPRPGKAPAEAIPEPAPRDAERVAVRP